jgi:hypothetical protein
VCVVTSIFVGYCFDGVIQTCHQSSQNLPGDNFDPSFTSLNMGLKRGVIGNTLGEQIGNLMGTSWELKGNKGKKKKILPPPPCRPHPKFKRKKSRHFECMLSLPIGCIKFLFPKLFITIFGLG